MGALLEKTFGTIWLHLKAVVDTPLEGQNHLYWLYILSFLALAAYSYKHYYFHGKSFSVKNFFRFVFPKDVYLHPSAIVDYEIFIANRFINALFRVLTTFIVAALATKTGDFMTLLFGEPAGRREWTAETMLLSTLIVGVSTDFASYLIHMLSHKIPVLWEFHKVHHTAEVLTPITLFRKHPVYDALGGFVGTPINSITQGVLLYIFVGKVAVVTLFGANLLYTAFRFFGANLRHSHVWLSWGPVLSRIFISPAQHQIHHSVDEKHRDKNFGEIIAVWDWIFGSLYIPKEKEEITFGVERGVPQEHDTLLRAYYRPFVNIWRMIARRAPKPAPKSA